MLTTAAVIAGCSSPPQIAREREEPTSARICLPVPSQGKGQWGACVHRMAYKYARAADPAEVVAKAVAESCGQQIAELINSTSPADRPELLKAVMGSIDGLALVKVIEAHAGHCEVPE